MEVPGGGGGWRGSSRRELELVTLEHDWKCQQTILGGFWGKTRRVVVGERSGKALIHQPLFLATVTAGYKEASDCVWRAVPESRTGACVCACVSTG